MILMIDKYELFSLFNRIRDFLCDHFDLDSDDYVSKLIKDIDDYRIKYNLFISDFYA